MSTPNPNPVYAAFQLAPVGPPLQPTVVQVGCPCSQKIAEISGWNIGIEIYEGMDLVATCRCGKQHSFQAQSAEARRLQAEAQAAQGGVPAEAPAEAPAAEAPKPNRASRRAAKPKAKDGAQV